MSQLPSAPAVPIERARDAAGLVPDWALRLAAEDDGAPYVSAARFVAGGYSPFSRDKTYAALGRYCERIVQLARKRGHAVTTTEEQMPRENELPGRRDGRQMLVSKRLYIVSVLGYLPKFDRHQP